MLPSLKCCPLFFLDCIHWLHLIDFILVFSLYYDSLHIQALMFLLPIDVFCSSFGALNCGNMLIFVRQFWFALVLFFLNWGFEWKGLKPRLYSEAMGHATLSPFSCNLCPNVRSPSARWNAPMVYEYDFVKLWWWGCFMYVGTT